MRINRRHRRLWDEYRFPGFRPSSTVKGVFGDPVARVITLNRRSKKQHAGAAVACIEAGTTAKLDACETSRAAMPACTWRWRYGESAAGVAAP